MLTTEQIKNRTKTVTRRLGWLKLKAGERLQGCVKCQGLKPGEKLQKLAVIEVVSVRRERLDLMLPDEYQPSLRLYGIQECVKEGFPNMKGGDFVKMFTEHMKCHSGNLVTRIEFKYIE